MPMHMLDKIYQGMMKFFKHIMRKKINLFFPLFKCSSKKINNKEIHKREKKS